MPWNNGGPGPWGNPPGSSGGDNNKKPTQGPWGNKGANDGGSERPTGDGKPGGPRPGGPFGGGGGPFGGGNIPELDKLIAQAQAYIRNLLGGGGGGGNGGGRTGGSGGGGLGGFANSRGLMFLLLLVP